MPPSLLMVQASVEAGGVSSEQFVEFTIRLEESTQFTCRDLM